MPVKDIKPLFNWAKQYGDANIYDRIFIKVMPQLLQYDIKLTTHAIETNDSIELPLELYDTIVTKTQELIGKNYV